MTCHRFGIQYVLPLENDSFPNLLQKEKTATNRRTPTVKQIVVASSDKAYGHQERLPYFEDTPLQGSHPYDVSKSCADLLARTYAASFGLPVVVTRCANLFGGGDLNWSRIVPGTIRSIVRGQRPELRSDGLYQRDYLYVEDAAAANMLLVEQLAHDSSLGGEAFNFSYEHPRTAIEIVRLILDLMHSDLEPHIQDQAVREIRNQCLSSAKAGKILGWKPLFTLQEGLQRSIDWYRGLLAEAS